MTEGRLDKLTRQDSGLPGDDPAGFFKRERQRYGWPNPEPLDFEEQKDSWFEEALAKKSRKSKENVRKQPEMSKTLQEQESERQNAEAGEDAKHGGATVTWTDTLSMSLAKLGDDCRNLADTIERLLCERLDHGSSGDAEEAHKDAERLAERIRAYKGNIKVFRQW